MPLIGLSGLWAAVFDKNHEFVVIFGPKMKPTGPEKVVYDKKWVWMTPGRFDTTNIVDQSAFNWTFWTLSRRFRQKSRIFGHFRAENEAYRSRKSSIWQEMTLKCIWMAPELSVLQIKSIKVTVIALTGTSAATFQEKRRFWSYFGPKFRFYVFWVVIFAGYLY